MSDSSDEMRALFDAGRRGHDPSAGDRERVKRDTLRALTGAVAIGAGASSAKAQGVGQALLGVPRSVLLKVVLGAALSGALVGAVVSGAWWLERGEPQPKQVSPAAQTALHSAASAVSAAPAPRAPAANESDAVRVGPPSPTLPHVVSTAAARVSSNARRASERDTLTAPSANREAASSSVSFPATPASLPIDGAASANASAEAARSTLDAEVRALANAQRELRGGRAALALSLLDAQAAQFRGGKLEQERQVARAVALCALGRTSEARALADRLLQQDPDSPLAARLRNTCPATSAGTTP